MQLPELPGRLHEGDGSMPCALPCERDLAPPRGPETGHMADARISKAPDGAADGKRGSGSTATGEARRRDSGGWRARSRAQALQLLTKDLRQLRRKPARFSGCLAEVPSVVRAPGCEGQQLSVAVETSPKGRFEEAVARRLGRELATAIQHLHQSRRVHCDIRPLNVLVSPDLWTLKLLDFGSSIELRPLQGGPEPSAGCGGAVARVGSLPCGRVAEQEEGGGEVHHIRSDTYTLPSSGDEVTCAPPEVVLGEQPSFPSDVWQLGLCLYFMISGRLPQQRGKREPTRESIRAVATQHIPLIGEHWKRVRDAGKAVISKCLAVDKLQRPSIQFLLKEAHWFEAAGGERTHRTHCALLGGLEPVQSPASKKATSCGSSTRASGPDNIRLSGISASNTSSPRTGCANTLILSQGANPPLTKKSFPQMSKTSSSSDRMSKLPSSKVALIGGQNEEAQVLVVNYAEGTYKLRLADGRIRRVSVEKILDT